MSPFRTAWVQHAHRNPIEPHILAIPSVLPLEPPATCGSPVARLWLTCGSPAARLRLPCTQLDQMTSWDPEWHARYAPCVLAIAAGLGAGDAFSQCSLYGLSSAAFPPLYTQALLMGA